jgi:hypothetical protein
MERQKESGPSGEEDEKLEGKRSLGDEDRKPKGKRPPRRKKT